MEGVAGVADPRQIQRGAHDFELARELMTRECNAAIEGAAEAGAQEFLVNDGHWDMCNLLPTQLSPRAELISGPRKPLMMCQGIGPGYDAAFFVGYHAAAGSRDGHIDHTYESWEVVQEMRINGRVQSEAAINAAVCGYFDCPMALVTGDAPAVSQAHELVTAVEGVVVKEGIGRYGARSLHPDEACARIRSGAKRAIERINNIPAVKVDSPIELEIDFAAAIMADYAERVPKVRRKSARTVGYSSDDYLEVFRLMLALVELGRAALV